LNVPFGGNEGFKKTGSGGALCCPEQRGCLIAMYNICDGQHSIGNGIIFVGIQEDYPKAETKGTSRRLRPTCLCVICRRIFTNHIEKCVKLKAVGLN
jgi:hypothetical protein